MKFKTYTTKDVARILNFNQEVIRRKIRNKEIPAIKVGSKWLVKEETIKKILGEI